jgi:hypothetical protein
MSPSHKKVIVRKWGGEIVAGYLPPVDFLERDVVGLLGLDGNVTSVPVGDIKWICFVRDFTSGDQGQPERLLQKTFRRRPRNPGLWVRARLKDNDSLDGLAQNDLSLLDNNGLLLIPPDTRSNTQRIFLPRQAIAQVEILAVVRVGTPGNPGRTLPQTLQGSLFKGEA